MGQESESEVISLLKDVQKRIGYLEKKIDALSKQSGGRSSSSRPSMGRTASSASSRSYAPAHGGSTRYKNKHESSYGTKNEQSGSSIRGFAKKKKAFGPAGKKRSNKS